MGNFWSSGSINKLMLLLLLYRYHYQSLPWMTAKELWPCPAQLPNRRPVRNAVFALDNTLTLSCRIRMQPNFSTEAFARKVATGNLLSCVTATSAALQVSPLLRPCIQAHYRCSSCSDAGGRWNVSERKGWHEDNASVIVALPECLLLATTVCG